MRNIESLDSKDKNPSLAWKSISPFLEKCENHYLLIEKHSHGVVVSQMGESVVGDYLISLSATLVFSVVHGVVHGAHGEERKCI